VASYNNGSLLKSERFGRKGMEWLIARGREARSVCVCGWGGGAGGEEEGFGGTSLTVVIVIPLKDTDYRALTIRHPGAKISL
jgi:hypothetical protein